jgi:5'-nucleotidase/2',3'-cyclic-nucleotide 2'-phosphodiesterase/3'-nucleotidase/5'-nucleotidase
MSLSEESWLNDRDGTFLVGNLSLDPQKVYRVVSHDYILSQWDKYLGFEPFEVEERGDLFLDAIINQIRVQFGNEEQ